MPFSGLCRNGRAKAAYKVLDRLINTEWNTCGSQVAENGKCTFNGFYGTYEIVVSTSDEKRTFTVDLTKDQKEISVAF